MNRSDASVASKRRAEGNSLVELVLIVAVALGLALGIQAFLVKPYRIPSESMVPTLDDRPARARQPHRQQLRRSGRSATSPSSTRPAGAENAKECGVAAQARPAVPARRRTTKADVNFIKRIVAGPGDTLAIEDGHVDPQRQAPGRAVHRALRRAARSATSRRRSRSRQDHYFMMGDNRGASDDSRFWGPVPREWIIGNAFATYWPPKRIGLL